MRGGILSIRLYLGRRDNDSERKLRPIRQGGRGVRCHAIYGIMLLMESWLSHRFLQPNFLLTPVLSQMNQDKKLTLYSEKKPGNPRIFASLCSRQEGEVHDAIKCRKKQLGCKTWARRRLGIIHACECYAISGRNL